MSLMSASNLPAGNSLANDALFHSGWREWIVENLVQRVSADELTRILVQSGFSEMFAREQVEACLADPVFQAAARAFAKNRKALDILDAMSRLGRQSPQAGTVAVETDISGESFYQDYFFAGRPVLLRGLASDWKATRHWTPEYFAKRFEDCEVEIAADREGDPEYERNFAQHRKKVLMRDYVRMVTEAGETNDFYLVAQNYLLRQPQFDELHDDVGCPRGIFDPARMRGAVRVWFGPRGAVTPLHHDPEPLMMCQIYGRKQVKLISPFHLRALESGSQWISLLDPCDIDYARYPKMRGVQIPEVTLHPGDLLFVPLGWWHWVKGLDVSISLSLDNCFLVSGVELNTA
jgi:hypothetical protein